MCAGRALIDKPDNVTGVMSLTETQESNMREAVQVTSLVFNSRLNRWISPSLPPQEILCQYQAGQG